MRSAIWAVLPLCGALTACGVPAWQTARTSIHAAEAALGPVEELLPDGDEEAATALSTTRAVLHLGTEITEAWEAQGERPWGWSQWVDQALEWCATIVQIVKGTGVDVPEGVAVAIGGLQILLPIVSALSGAS